MTISASPFFLSTSSDNINLVKYLVQNLTASDAAFLTSSATRQTGPTPVSTVALPLPADTIVYEGEVPGATVGGDGPDPVPLDLEVVEVGSCSIFSQICSTVLLP